MECEQDDAAYFLQACKDTIGQLDFSRSDLKVLEKAAKSGHTNAMHQQALVLITRGKLSEGIDYLERSAQQGHDLAAYDVGCIYKLGVGTEVDFKKAELYLRKASDSGLQRATLELGNLKYERCQFGPAFKLYMKLCRGRSEESAIARYNVSEMLHSGKGVEPNPGLARIFLIKAAYLRNPSAQSMVAQYLMSEAPPRLGLATVWAARAAAQGDPDGAELIDTLSRDAGFHSGRRRARSQFRMPSRTLH